MSFNGWFQKIKPYFLLTFGSFLMAASVNSFAIPNQLGEGGVPGLTMLLYYLLKLPTAATSLALNGFLLIIGLKILDKKTILKTVYVIITNSIFLHLLQDQVYLFKDSFISPLVAGGLMGLGIGLIYLGEGTAAGGTIIAKMLEVKTGLAKSKGILITDLSVILPSIFVIGFERVCLTVVSVYFGSRVIAFITEGAKPKKNVLIISPKVVEISNEIASTLQRNGTFLTGTGSYSNQEQKMLYVVVEAPEILELKQIVHQLDQDAFVVVTDAQNVLGTRFEG